MADNILRLRVDSQEYDNKIKRAAEGIQQYAQKCREVGGTLEHLDEGVLEFVQALGKMDTVATSTKQQVRELSNALTTLTMTYRGLTDEEKASPFGQELAKGIQQLTERAGQAQDAMADVQASIRNAASDTRTFDQMAQGMSVATAGFQGLTGAGKLLGIEMGNDVEIIAKLQAAMAVTNSLTTIQTALQKESALMMGIASIQTKAAAVAQSLLAKNTIAATVAGKAFNIVAKANPIGMIVTGVGLAAGALSLFSGKSKEATEAEKKMAEAAKEAEEAQKQYREEIEKLRASTEAKLYGTFIKLQASWEKLQTTAEKTQWIKDNTSAFNQLGVSIKSISDAEDVLVNNTQAIVEAIQLRARAAVLTRQIEKALENGIENPGSGDGFAPEGKYNIGFGISQNLARELADVETQIDAIMSKWRKGTGGGGGHTNTTTTTTKEITETQQLQKNIEALTKEYQQLSDVEKVADFNMAAGIELRKAAIRGEIKTNQQRIDELKKFADEAQGKNLEVKVDIVPVNGSSFTQESISKYVQELQKQLSTLDMSMGGSSAMANDLYANIVDAQTFGNLLKTSIQHGIDLAAVGIDTTSLWEQITNGDGLEDADWKGFVEKINEQLKKQGIKLNIDPQTGNISTDKKEKNTTSKALEKFNGDFSKLTGGVSSIVSGIQSMGVEIPKSIQSVMGVLTGISSIMSGIASMVAVIEVLTATKATPVIGTLLAGGGIIHAAGGTIVGNSYSGDNLRGIGPGGQIYGLNADELVLNKFQQQALAGTLENGGLKNITISGALRGEDIVLSADRWGRRTGKGELLFAKNL